MSDNPKTLEQEVSDEMAFKESLFCLVRSTFWLKWSAIGATVLAIAAITALVLSPPPSPDAAPGQLDRTLLVGGLFALMLLSNVHVFFQQRYLKGVRNRLAEQMAIAVKHRTRAEKFYNLAVIDPLTGLYNRRYGEERLKEEILRAEKNGEPLAVILMDLDYFKEINDQYGHAAGDLVLKELARRLKRAVRACDVPIRIGGDEFVLVLPECAKENVDVILARLGSFEVRLHDQAIAVACSIGRAQHQVADTPETILRRADEVLYAVKAARGGHKGQTPETSEGADSSPYCGDPVSFVKE